MDTLMWLSFITAWRVRRRLRKLNPGGVRVFDDTERLVLLVQGKDMPSVEPVLRELTSGGMKVILVVETRHKDDLPVAIPGCYPILQLHTSWLWNRPTRQFLDSFDNNDGDVLLDVSITRSLPLLYLALHSRAAFKIGVAKDEENPFHLQILIPAHRPDSETDAGPNPLGKIKPDAGELLKNALFYWKKIGVKENNL